MQRRVVLTVAGSDSGGGAGLQADLRTVAALGGFGATAVTCVTAQNLEGVDSVFPVPPAEVLAQIRAVLRGFRVRAVKTGMLYSRGIIEAVAHEAMRTDFPPLVVDPVMAAASGARLLEPGAEDAYRDELLPLASIITPNLDEAGALLGREIGTEREMGEAAEELGRTLGVSIFLKGGHLPGDPVDFLWHEGDLHCWPTDRVHGVNTHGSGCILSAAIATRLALGDAMVAACSEARRFLLDSFRRPARLEGGNALPGIPGRD